MIEPIEWLIHGGGGHEDGADGLRALTVSGEGLVDFLEAYRDALAEEQQAADKWKQAVIDKLVVNFILTAEHETNPEKALNDLLAWEMKCALDPAISGEAAKLQGDSQAMVAAAYETAAQRITLMIDTLASLPKSDFPSDQHRREFAIDGLRDAIESIRALTPADTQAALDKLLAQAREGGFINGWTRHTIYKPLSEELAAYLATLESALAAPAQPQTKVIDASGAPNIPGNLILAAPAQGEKEVK